jgi:hypothetical protein
MGWVGHVTHMGAGGGGCAQDFSGETCGIPIGKSRRRWEYNVIGEAYAYNVILRRVRVVIVGVEKQ